MPALRVLVPLPDNDFDVTEVSVPWRLLTRRGIQVVFATERGQAAACDPLLLTGVVFGQLGAEPEARAFYREMVQTDAFQKPLCFGEVDVAEFDGLLLAGGHAQGMRPYLESETLQKIARKFFSDRRTVAAICHGVLVLARTKDKETGRSVLFDRRTTCLPAYMERSAYFLTAWKLGKYYRTYPAYVQDEVTSALAHPEQFIRGPIHLTQKGSLSDDSAAFVVEDGFYLSARWPGDAYKLAKMFGDKLAARQTSAARRSGKG